MTSEEHKIIDIKVNYKDAINGIAQFTAKIEELKASQKDLARQLRDGDISAEEYRKQIAATDSVITQYKDNIKTLKKEIQNNLRQEQEQEGSLKSLRAQLSNATKAYDELSRAEREGAKGKELKNHINEITEELKGAEEATERYYRNVGNYENAIKSVLGANSQFASSIMSLASDGGGVTGFFNNAKASVQAFGAALLGLMSNPVFLGLAGIAGAGAAFKWFYDYNMGLTKATQMTQQFTGLTGNELKAVRNEVQVTADTFGLDFNEVLQGANSMSKAFGTDMGESLRLIQQGMESGANANGQFMDTLREYPRYFEEAGLSAEEFVAITTQSAKDGVFSDKGVDAIKEANIRLRQMTDSTAQALEGIGISSEEVQKGLQDGSLKTFDVMQMVSEKLNELPESSSKVGTAIADIFGGPGEDAGIGYLKTLGKIETNMDEVVKKSGDIAEAQEMQLKSQRELNNVVTALFDKTGGGFEKMRAQIMTIANNALTSLIKGIIKVVNYLVDVYNESTALRLAVQAIGFQFKTVWEVVKLFFQGLVNGFKSAANVARGFLEFLEGTFSLDVKKAGKGVNDMLKAVAGMYAGNVRLFKDAGKNIADAFVDGMAQTFQKDRKRLEKIEIPTIAAGGNRKIKTKDDDKNDDDKKLPPPPGGDGKGGGTLSERLKAEQEEIRKAEDLMTQLINDGAEQQRAQINANYDRQIADIRKRLEEEKDLTATAREAMNSQIVSLEKLRRRELAKLDADELQRQAEFENQRIQLILKSVKEGSDQERVLRLMEIENQERMDIAKAQAQYTNEEERQQMLAALRQEYEHQREEVEANYYNGYLDRLQERLRREYDLRAQATNDQVEQERLRLEMLARIRESDRQRDGESEQEYQERRAQMNLEYTRQEEKLAATRAQVNQQAASAVGDAFGAMSQVMKNASKEETALTKVAKVLALAQVAFNIGKAISAMVSAEAPKGIVGIATMAAGIASILTQMASALSIINSAGFSRGGYVSGKGSGTSDSIPARLSNGESVMTARATSMFSPLLSTFNQLGGGVPISVNMAGASVGEDFLAAAVARGFMSCPAPVVSVEEITSVQDKVRTRQRIARL